MASYVVFLLDYAKVITYFYTAKLFERKMITSARACSLCKAKSPVIPFKLFFRTKDQEKCRLQRRTGVQADQRRYWTFCVKHITFENRRDRFWNRPQITLEESIPPIFFPIFLLPYRHSEVDFLAQLADVLIIYQNKRCSLLAK